MHMNPANPVWVQADGKVMLETKHREFDRARDFLARFAEIESSPEMMHTYRISPLSLWNAASAGMTLSEVIDGLRGLSKFDIPEVVRTQIEDTLGRYGLVELQRHPDEPAAWLRVMFANRYIEKTVLATATGKQLVQADGKQIYEVSGLKVGLFQDAAPAAAAG